MIQSDLALAMEERIENLTIPVVLPPRAQLPIPHAVQPIDQPRKLVAQQRVEVLIAQMPAEMVFARQPIHLLRVHALRKQFRRPDALQIQHNHARIEARKAVLRVLRRQRSRRSSGIAVAAVVDGIAVVVAVRRRRLGRIVGLAEVRVRIPRAILVENVIVDGRQFGGESEEVFGRESAGRGEENNRIYSRILHVAIAN